MSWQFSLMVLGAAVILIVSMLFIVEREAKKPKKKQPNVRVPRQTLWERTNKYHGDTQ